MGLDHVLEDVLKFSVVRRHRDFEIASRIEGRLLKLASSHPGQSVNKLCQSDARALITSRDFEGIEWDHSRVGLNVSLHSLGTMITIYLPNAGVHRFETFKEVARIDPAVVFEVLSPLFATEIRPAAVHVAEPVAAVGAVEISQST